jgi:hypothetical protein
MHEDTHDAFEAREMIERLMTGAIEEGCDEFRLHLFALYYVGGYTLAELGAEHGISRERVRQLIAQAHSAMARVLRKDDERSGRDWQRARELTRAFAAQCRAARDREVAEREREEAKRREAAERQAIAELRRFNEQRRALWRAQLGGVREFISTPEGIIWL